MRVSLGGPNHGALAATETKPRAIFLWHVHGSWMTAFVQGPHRYYVPLLPDRGPDGRGRAQTWDWPSSVVEVTREQARDLAIDCVIVQRPAELSDLVEDWLGRKPGADLPALYLEHDVPQGTLEQMRHPAADRPDLTIVHVTHFNDLFWDCGTTATRVIEHGVVDPGYRYTGEIERAGVVINEAGRRGRVTGTDLLRRFDRALPLDLFGMGATALGGFENLRQADLHRELPRRRVYLHPFRWTSLGLALIEAMHLGMPVVGLATTEAVEAVPRAAGILSTNVEQLCLALREFGCDARRARAMGEAARAFALERYGLAKFLRAWDALLEAVVA
jgi:glycosyltransferase involved in cell wall biosynthesis